MVKSLNLKKNWGYFLWYWNMMMREKEVLRQILLFFNNIYWLRGYHHMGMKVWKSRLTGTAASLFLDPDLLTLVNTQLMSWDLNLGPLWEQDRLINNEPPLQALTPTLFYSFILPSYLTSWLPFALPQLYLPTLFRSPRSSLLCSPFLFQRERKEREKKRILSRDIHQIWQNK